MNSTKNSIGENFLDDFSLKSSDNNPVSSSNTRIFSSANSNSLSDNNLSRSKLERDRLLTENAREAKTKLLEVAEEKIRVFAEQTRLLSDDLGERQKDYERVIQVQKERKQLKRNATNQYIGTIITELINNCFSSVGLDSETIELPQYTPLNDDPLKSLLESVNHLVVNEKEILQCQSFKKLTKEMISTESWSMYSAYALNIGKFQFIESKRVNVEDSTSIESEKIKSQNQLGDGDSNNLSENSLENEKLSSEGTDPEMQKNEGDALLFQPELSSVECKLERELSFIDSIQIIYESLLKCDPTSLSNYDHIKINNNEEKIFFDKKCLNKSNVILVLGQGNQVPLEIWQSAVENVGGEQTIENWNLVSACFIASKLSPLMQGKNPQLKLSHLADIFTLGKTPLPDNINRDVSPECMKVVVDILENYGKILSTQQLFSNDSLKSLKDVTFDDTYLFMLFGEILWLREYLRLIWVAQLESECPLVTNILASRGFGTTRDTVENIRVFDWFLKGGTKDNIPETEPELNETIKGSLEKFSNSGGKAKAKPPPAKGKSVPVTEEIPKECEVSSLIWIRSGYTSNSKIHHPFQSSSDDEGLAVLIQALNKYEELRNAEVESNTMLDHKNIVDYCFSHTEIVFVNCLQTLESNTLEEASEASQGPYTIRVKNNFLYIELLLGLLSYKLKNKDESSSFSAITDSSRLIYDQVLSRRAFLSPSKKILLQHSTGENVFSPDKLHENLNSLYMYRRLEVNLVGALLYITFSHLQKTKNYLRLEEAKSIANLKSNDTKWENICKKFNLIELQPNIDYKIYMDDLVCSIGDVIDERHKNWLNDFKTFKTDTFAEIKNSIDSLLKISDVFSDTVFFLYEHQKHIINSFVDILKTSNYTQVPFKLSSQNIKGSHLSLSLKKDQLKYFGVKLNQIKEFNSAELNFSGEESTCWSKLILQNNDFMFALKDDEILRDCHGELFQNVITESICIVKSYFEEITNLKESQNNLVTQINDSIFNKHKYEHEYLRKWNKDLRQIVNNYISFQSNLKNEKDNNSSTNNMNKAKTSLSVNNISFKPSVDSKEDRVLYKYGQGLIELGDMVLDINLIGLLADDLLNKENSSINLTDQIKMSIQNLKIDFPFSWRNTEKLNSFIDNYNIKNTRELIIILLLGTLAQPFSDRTINFILHSFNKMNDKNLSDKFSVSDATFLESLTKSKIISFLESEYKSRHKIYYSSIKVFISLSRTTKSTLNVQKFFYYLCSCSVVIDHAIFESNLLCYKNEDCQYTSFISDNLPKFYRPGLYKALNVTKCLSQSGNENTSYQSDTSYNSFLGSSLTTNQLKSLLKYAKYEEYISDEIIFGYSDYKALFAKVDLSSKSSPTSNDNSNNSNSNGAECKADLNEIFYSTDLIAFLWENCKFRGRLSTIDQFDST